MLKASAVTGFGLSSPTHPYVAAGGLRRHLAR